MLNVSFAITGRTLQLPDFTVDKKVGRFYISPRYKLHISPEVFRQNYRRRQLFMVGIGF